MPRHRSASVALLALLILPGNPPPAGAAFPRLQIDVVADGQIVSPVGIANAGDGSDRLFVVDQRGLVHILNAERMVLPAPFIDLRAKLVNERANFDERGLLSIAFHPDYATPDATGEGKFYVYYSAPSAVPASDHRSVIAEFSVSADDPDRADPDSERVLLTIEQPQFNHDGGQLAFGPDSLLYISTGDGGGADDNQPGHTGGAAGNRNSRPKDALGNAQDLTRLLGKILRIDVFGTDGAGGEYGIPESNPFAASDGPERDEIFVYGLRNPWRFSFDVGPGGSGDLFVADVGQNKFEEVNIIDVGPGGDAGGNYGWRIKEGTASFDFSTLADPGDLIDPVAEYAHPGVTSALLKIGISVTAGAVYHGAEIPALDGKYVFADWSTTFSAPGAGTLLGMEPDGGGGWEISVLDLVGDNPLPYFINAFGRDEAGEIYIAAKTRLPAGGTDNGQPTGVVLRLHDGEQRSLTLAPSKDTSIYEANLANSNGAGVHLFSGTTGGASAERALLAFDIAAAIPAGSQIDTATLKVQVNAVPGPPAGPGVFTLHRGLADWGEGASDGAQGGGAPATTGDATWTRRFFPDTTWDNPGGDFAPTTSATVDTGSATGPFTFSSAALAADVRLWSAAPASNCGWFLVGGSAAKSARRFSSRESPTAADRPALTIDFVPAPALGRYRAWRREFFPPGTFIDDAADLDSDGLANLIDYAFAFDPTTFDAAGRPAVSITPEGDFLLTYRRDPRATDLTYRAEVSSTLLPELWSPLAESTAGAASTGPGFVSETPIPGEKPLLRVTVRDTVAAPGGAIRFLRLYVERSP